MKKFRKMICWLILLVQVMQPVGVFAQEASVSAQSNVPILSVSSPTIADVVRAASASATVIPTPTSILAGLVGLETPLASPSVSFNFLSLASPSAEASISATPTPAIVFTPSPEPNIDPPLVVSSARLKRKSTLRKLSKKHFRSAETVRLLLDDALKSDITVTVTDPDGKLAAVDTSIIELQTGVEIRLLPKVLFRPGKYKVLIRDASTNQSFEQDYTWGVLAINTDKSVYTPGDTASIQIAVLDEQGMMACDAIIDLVVTDPIDRTETKSTRDKSIKISDTCAVRDYVTEPDFSTTYKTTISGRYLLQLTATTKNGTYNISDAFEADSDVAFSVKRKAVTRIYPPKIYPVELSVVANEDFTGRITETVPQDFVITPLGGTRKFDDVQIRSVVDEGKKGTRIRLGNPFEGNFPMTQGFGEEVTDTDLLARYKQYGIAGHDGVDFALQTGTPVLAVDDGVVILAGLGAYGVTVVIQHDWGRSYYGHLSKVLVKNDQKVTKGTEIALSGNTGESTGPHLHFAMKLNNPDDTNGYKGKIDPLPYLNASLVDFTDTAVKVITWQVSMKKGESITIGYQYKAPDISPKLYLTGPLRFRASDKQLDLSTPNASGSSPWEDPFILGVASPSAVATESALVSSPSLGLTPTPASSSAIATQAGEFVETVQSASSDSAKADIFAGVVKQFEIQKRQATSSGQVLGNIVETKSVDTTEGVLVFAEKRQWQIAADALPADGDGLIVYGDIGDGTARYRTYTNASNTFSGQSTTAAGSGGGPKYVLKTSPKKQEAIATVSNWDTELSIYCYDGTNWSLDIDTTGYLTTDATVSYETNSGDVLVVMGDHEFDQQLYYWTKSGSTGCGAGNWSGPTLYTISAGGAGSRPYYFKSASDPRASSDLIAVAFSMTGADLAGVIWNGSSFTNESGLLSANNSNGYDNAFDLEYEASSGDLMVVHGANGGSSEYATCTGGTSSCSWSLGNSLGSTNATDANFDLCANYQNNELVVGAMTEGGTFHAGYWSGSAWTITDNLDTTSFLPNFFSTPTQVVSCGFLTSGATTRSVIIYEDNSSTNISYATGNTSTFTVEADSSPTPSFANPQFWYDVQVDPKNRDRLMLAINDNNSDFFAKRLVMTSTPTFTWTNADGGSALQTSLSAVYDQEGQFAYWQYTSPALDTILRHGATLQGGVEGAFSF